MRLKDEFLLGGLTRIQEIGHYLDALDPGDRLREIRALCPRTMAMLYARAAHAPPLTQEHFVLAGTPSATEVIHHGWNSLPAFRGFQKRFCRSARAGTGDPVVVGYNHNPPFLRALGITPGYFVLRSTAGAPHWARRGALVIDYHVTPDGPVPPGWPPVVPSSQGLQSLAFGYTRDFMRGVSSHVSIGAAFKWEQGLGVYFVLCREPAT